MNSTRVRVGALIALLALGAASWAALATQGDDPDPAGDPPEKRASYLEGACALPPQWVDRIERGWIPGPARDADLILVAKEGNYAGTQTYTSHSGPYDFLQRVPLVFYGPGFVEEVGDVELSRQVTLADLPATQAAVLGFDWPRPAQPLTEVLKQNPTPPALIVTIVIDGGGWNVLDEWPDAWPQLRELMASGASVENVIVGSTPSITPAIHTTLSTGVWPREHGVTSTVVRSDDGSLVGAFSKDPANASAALADPTVSLAQTTLADLWDRDTENKAKIAMVGGGNYLLGMIGHGSALDGADKDIAAMAKGAKWATNPRFYSVPTYLNTDVFPGIDSDVAAVDRRDGRLDGKWLGHAIERDASPALAPWVTRTVTTLIDRSRFGDDSVTDLLYMNYKATDLAGHRYNMVNPEVRDVLASTDASIGELVSFLDQEVGRNRYMLVVTADHGQTPTGLGWPINQTELVKDIDRRFDRTDNETSLIETTTAVTLFMNQGELETNDVTADDVATWAAGYKIGDNVPQGRDVPEPFQTRTNEPIYDAAFPGGALPDVVTCTRRD